MEEEEDEDVEELVVDDRSMVEERWIWLASRRVG
jgi:hypothetical protein